LSKGKPGIKKSHHKQCDFFALRIISCELLPQNHIQGVNNTREPHKNGQNNIDPERTINPLGLHPHRKGRDKERYDYLYNFVVHRLSPFFIFYG
jgi:hypothetical protein